MCRWTLMMTRELTLPTREKERRKLQAYSKRTKYIKKCSEIECIVPGCTVHLRITSGPWKNGKVRGRLFNSTNLQPVFVTKEDRVEYNCIENKDQSWNLQYHHVTSPTITRPPILSSHYPPVKKESEILEARRICFFLLRMYWFACSMSRSCWWCLE